MAFSDLEAALVRNLHEEWGLKLLQPAQFVGQIYPLYQIVGQSVLLGLSRPDWLGGPECMDRHFGKHLAALQAGQTPAMDIQSEYMIHLCLESIG